MVLKQFGQLLKDSSREIDIVARYGGEEFSIILPTTNLEEAIKFAERVRKNIEEFDFKGHSEPLKVTTSIGVSEWEVNEDFESIITRADKGLYLAKNKKLSDLLDELF